MLMVEFATAVVFELAMFVLEMVAEGLAELFMGLLNRSRG